MGFLRITWGHLLAVQPPSPITQSESESPGPDLGLCIHKTVILSAPRLEKRSEDSKGVANRDMGETSLPAPRSPMAVKRTQGRRDPGITQTGMEGEGLPPVQPGVPIACLGLGIAFISWAVTKHHRLVGLNSRHLSSLSTRGWKSRSKCRGGLASSEALLFGR